MQGAALFVESHMHGYSGERCENQATRVRKLTPTYPNLPFAVVVARYTAVISA